MKTNKMKQCKWCKRNTAEESGTQIILGDITCCGDKNNGDSNKICRQEGHINFICRNCPRFGGIVWTETKDEDTPITVANESLER